MDKEMLMNNQELGAWGEEQAVRYLTHLGYRIIALNYRTPLGELDVVASYMGALHFIEVKTRTSQKYGFAAEAVDDNKKRHLLNSIRYYVYSRNLQNEFIRIDVIEVYINNGKRTINHIKQAI